MTSSDETAARAAKHLKQYDPVLAPVIDFIGPYPIRPHKNYYSELVDSIISQQLSVAAAAAIEKRFCALFGGTEFPEPKAILLKSAEELRSVGLSRPKVAYIHDLAQAVVEGRVKFEHLDTLDNEAVIAKLTAVKGIGVWTVHMFLMFCMGRLGVLAYGDLGVRNGIKKLYGLKQVPDQAKVEEIAKKYHWHPYESVACWYIWQSLKNAPKL